MTKKKAPRASLPEANLDEWTVLHFAAVVGDINGVRELINKGMNVDAADSGGWTPLRVAASNGHIDIVSALLAAGADVRCCDRDGSRASDLARSAGHRAVAVLLEKVESKDKATSKGR